VNERMISSVQKAPCLTQDEAARIVFDLYGIEGSAAPLPSERDQNFQISGEGEKYVLKIANSEESVRFLELQNQLIQFLSARHTDLEFARLVPSRSGETISRIKDQRGREHFVRLLSWLDGDCLAQVQPHRRLLLASLGRALAQMDAALTEFSHPAAERSFYWDLRHAGMAREFAGLLPDSRRPLTDRFFSEWEKIDWNRLRFSVIHNDGNDYNILVRELAPAGPRVTAILDFGDVVYSATVCNLAVALAYVMLDKPDPIGAAAQVVAAYHETYPLTEAEIQVLFTLAAIRLCCSVCLAAKQAREAPDNQYLNISNAPAWHLLERLSDLTLEWPTTMFRYACGLSPLKQMSNPAMNELIRARRQRLGPSLSVSYETPLHIVAGSRQYLYAADGRRYLDCVNNVAHVGHCHPYVVRAGAKQMALLNTNTRYLHEQLIYYANRLTELLPDPLKVVFLVNSGSEANELALRLARAHTGRKDVIVVESAYHGNTSAMIDLSPYKFEGPGGNGCPGWVHKVPRPDVFRGPHRGVNAGQKYAQAVAAAAHRNQGNQGSHGPAAFFCESALSCGGQIILPAGFLPAAFAAVRAAGGVCVADEVQTGFGRAGEHFWMFESQNVVPDIVTLGKPIGNGHPLGAVITTREIADSFANGMEYFNTFGGNPVSCAIGLAVLDVIRDEELQQNAADTGEYLKNDLTQLQATYHLIGEVRGSGLFLGIEFVRQRDSLEPADIEASQIVELMKARGILLSTDGPFHNVIKIKPPIVFSRRDADFLISNLNDVLAEL